MFADRIRASAALALGVALWFAAPAQAASTETSNGCRETQDDPCVRVGSCEIQGSRWNQEVTVARSDIFDTQGWPGLCDMVHVGLVQGNCEPPAAQLAVTVFLSDASSAWIPEIVGPLACAGEPEPPAVPASGALGRVVLVAAILATALLRTRARARGRSIVA